MFLSGGPRCLINQGEAENHRGRERQHSCLERFTSELRTVQKTEDVGDRAVSGLIAEQVAVPVELDLDVHEDIADRRRQRAGGPRRGASPSAARRRYERSG